MPEPAAPVAARRGRTLVTGARALLVMFQASLIAALLLEVLFQRVVVGGGHQDFLAFYSASDLVRIQQPQFIYNGSVVAFFQHAILGRSVGALGYMPFLNPPFVAAGLAPLSVIPLSLSRMAWFLANLTLAGALIIAMTSPLSRWQRVGCVLLLLSTFPMYQSLVQGQLSIALLGGSYVALLAMRKHRPGVAGVGLSVLWVKPQFAVIILAGLVIFRCWRTIAAMLASLVGFSIVTLPLVGLGAYRVYPAFLLQTLRDHVGQYGPSSAWSGDLTRAEGLNGLVISWLGNGRATNLIVLGLMALTVGAFLLAARRVRPGLAPGAPRRVLLAGLFVLLLVDPHLYAQDIVIFLIIVPILLAGPSLKGYWPWVLCLFLDLPLIDNFWPLHLFTMILWLATLFVSVSIWRQKTGNHQASPPRAPVTVPEFAA